MHTERRDTPRIPIALDAILGFNTPRPEPSMIHDISLDGAFAESPAGRGSNRGALECAIKLPVDGQHKYYRFHGRVVRTTDAGVALQFDQIDADAYAALLDFVFSRQGRGLW